MDKAATPQVEGLADKALTSPVIWAAVRSGDDLFLFIYFFVDLIVCGGIMLGSHSDVM